MRKWDELPGDDEKYDPTVIAAWNLRYEDPDRYVETECRRGRGDGRCF